MTDPSPPGRGHPADDGDDAPAASAGFALDVDRETLPDGRTITYYSRRGAVAPPDDERSA